MIKLLHTGDIHLDSAFSALDPKNSEIRRNELRAAFTSMITYAKMTNVDAILIAGDLFDGEYVTKETVAILRREFENFGKPIFIAPGNHDCATQSSIWHKKIFSDNVYVFTEEALAAVDIDELSLTVYGYAFTSHDMPTFPAAGLSVDDPSRVNVLLAHGDVTSTATTSTCPISEEDIYAFGADYTALGHIHNPTVSGKDERYCYCGCLEGRGFDELGPKGACMVEITKNGSESTVVVKKVRFSKRKYERGELSLDGIESTLDAADAIASYISEHKYGEDTLLSLRLTGYISPSLVLDMEVLEDDTHGLYYLKLEDATHPSLDTAALENDVTIRGEVYRRLKPSIQSSDARTREIGLRALRYAFSALSGENNF